MKLTKADRKIISRLAGTLPEFSHDNQVISQRVTGSSLIAKGKKTTADGLDIHPDKFYTTEVKKPVNHRKAMEGYFEKGGMVAVNDYAKAIKSQ